MVTITDVEKLRPELLTMSVAELERRRSEIDMALARVEAAEEAKRRAELIEEAGGHVDAVIKSVRWLHDNSFLPQRVVDAFTRGDGQFNPATFLRHPRTEDTLVIKRPDAPKRKRRTKAEIEAARAAGGR